MKEKAKPVASTDVIVGDLQKFFETDQSRTTVGRLREMFDTIEKLRDGGMSLEKIRLVLDKNNLKISLATLTKSLQRIRGERDVDVTVAKTEQKPKRAKAKTKDVPPATATIEVGTGTASKRPPPLLSEDKGVWGKLKPSPVDGTVDLKQK